MSLQLNSTTDAVLLLNDIKEKKSIPVPFEILTNMVFIKNRENANVLPNPEAVKMAVSDYVLKEFFLEEVFPEEVATAHRLGEIHIHDLAQAGLTCYCGGHSLDFLKKFGLNIPNITSVSKPAKYPETLIGHMVKFASVIQAHYAGAVGWEAVNLFLAPMFLGMDDKRIKQNLQMLIFEFNQLATSRGQQITFTDFNLYYEVPKHYRNSKAIGPEGNYMLVDEEYKDIEADEAFRKNLITFTKSEENPPGKVFLTYNNFSYLSKKVLEKLFEVYYEGDAFGKTFFFPKPLLHIGKSFFEEPGWEKILETACKIVAKNGIIYFLFDRDSASMAQCCRLRLNIPECELESFTKNTESIRFSSLQNVTINLPRVAYYAEGDLNVFYKFLDRLLYLAVLAHVAKRDYLKKVLNNTEILEFYKMETDNQPYVNLDKVTSIIGVFALSDTLKTLIGSEIHETPEALELGKEIVKFMKESAEKYAEQFGLYKVVLEESPAESATYRLANLDLKFFPEKAKQIVRKNEYGYYYSNSVHVPYDATISWYERVYIQSLFSPLIEGGGITHIWLGENKPKIKALYDFVIKTYKNTLAQQIAFSPEFTICKDCGNHLRGLKELCEKCGSTNVYHFTRIVGYYSVIENWNPGKLAELKDRVRMNVS